MRVGKRVPDLAVIIPARNEASRLGGCLDSVREALEFAGVADAEVIVVDDDSADETSDVARAHGALPLRQSRRLGPLAAWSLGVAHSSASLLFFADADCRVDKGAFSALLRGFARPPVGVIAARGEPYRERTVNSLVERSATFSALMLNETKSRLVNHDFLPIGRLMALRRAAWQEGDHRWPCDRTVAARAKRAGWEDHLHGGSGRVLPAGPDVRRTPVRLRSHGNRARTPPRRVVGSNSTRSREPRRLREPSTAAFERGRLARPQGAPVERAVVWPDAP